MKMMFLSLHASYPTVTCFFDWLKSFGQRRFLVLFNKILVIALTSAISRRADFYLLSIFDDPDPIKALESHFFYQ